MLHLRHSYDLYENSYICNFGIKVVGLNRSYSANTKPIWKNLNPQKPENLRFAPVIIIQFLFRIFYRYNLRILLHLVRIIRITSPELQPMAV